MADQLAQDPDSRAEFEADAEPMGFDLTRISLPVPEPWSEYADENTGHRWGGWLAATQRQQERIAYVEKIADDAIELGNQQAIRIAELEAQVQALSRDAERWKTFISLPYAIRSEWACNLSLAPVLTEWIDQAVIDAAIQKATHKEKA